jgi:UDP-N-acetyl-D-glucosamine dehydrogenase
MEVVVPRPLTLEADPAHAAAQMAAVPAVRPLCVAVVGLGYVGLPTALAFQAAGVPVVGFDVSGERLDAIRAEAVDLSPVDATRLSAALAAGSLHLTTMPNVIEAADAVIICAPTPVDAERRPDPRALQAACADAVAHARAGQTIVLTSTTYVGSTRELLVRPLVDRGLQPGVDLDVAFSPERILPGDTSATPGSVPRVLGGASASCVARARALLQPTASRIHAVSSLEAAEFTKLFENTFRAVNLAFANEMATVSKHLGLDPVEIVDAAATKPYGYLAHYPGPGVGGHCIPVDPHYLLAPLRAEGLRAAITEEAMAAIERRPATIAARVLTLLRERGVDPAEANVLIVGMAYKPGVADARESPGVALADRLEGLGVRGLAYHDPFVASVRLRRGRTLHSLPKPDPERFDLIVVTTLHDCGECDWLIKAEHILDATYRAPLGDRRHLV